MMTIIRLPLPVLVIKLSILRFFYSLMNLLTFRLLLPTICVSVELQMLCSEV